MLKLVFNVAKIVFFTMLNSPSLLASGRQQNSTPYTGIINIRAQNITQIDSRFDIYQVFLGGLVPKDHIFRSLGSGAFIDTTLGGLVVTNYHFLKNARNFVGVELGSREEIELKLLGTDEAMNIAVLEPVGKHSWHKLSTGQSSALRINESVTLVASPFGLSPLVMESHIAAKGGVVGTTQADKNYYLDRSINAALSGGGVFDTRSRIVGITSAFGFFENLEAGLMIPIEKISMILGDIKKFGTTRKLWLGIIAKNIYVKENTPGDPELMGSEGVIVENLVAGGPAQKSGLKIGDIITSINERPVADSHKLQEILLNKSLITKEKKMVIQVFRRSSGALKIIIPVEERPKAQDLPKDQDLL